LKIVTRASTEEELKRFEHPRMPVIEAPLYSAEPVPLPEPPASAAEPDDPQGRLL
jgi:hypothetical protein